MLAFISEDFELSVKVTIFLLTMTGNTRIDGTLLFLRGVVDEFTVQ